MADFNDYAPVSKAEAAAVAPAPASDAAVAPAPVPAKVRPPAPVPLGGPLRSLTIRLAYPLGYDGREYRAITLRRPTSAEVGRFFEDLVVGADADEAGLLFFPVFYAEDGAPVPNTVLANLDDDDRADVMGRVADFLPRRLQALRASDPPASGADTGDATAPTSST